MEKTVKKVIDVVAALIWKDNKFLICRRPAHKARGLLWEFAGGKVEKGESEENALKRECGEELNIGISVGEKFAEVTHEYSDITVHLTLFNCIITDGEPQMIEHADLKWITPSQIPEFDFCPADTVFLNLISKL